MPSTTGNGRILIIASYDGPRHPSMRPAEMLRIQHQQLTKLKHSLDKVLIVVNEASPNPDYEEALKLFPDQLRRENIQGSYGAWKDAYLAYPDYEWYFFTEDDQTFFLDDFDQKWIDMWEPDMGYLAVRVEGPTGRFIRHASVASGLLKTSHASVPHGLSTANTLKTIDWGRLPMVDQYDWKLQVEWGQLFGPEGLYDITSRYDSPFWTGKEITRTDPTKPVLIGPMQLL